MTKRIGIRVTDEQYRRIEGLARKRKLTIPNLIRETFGLPIRGSKRVFIDFDLPHGGLSELSRRTGNTPGRIFYWRSSGVPEKEVENVLKIIEDIKLDYQKPEKQTLFVTEGCLGKPPRGTLAKLARQLERPYNTVRHWHKYGIPKESKGEVEKALKELGY